MRITSSVTHKKRVKKVRKEAKGYYGKRKNIYSIAKQSVTRSGMFAFAHRRKKKGDFRRIWQVRINAALSQFGLPSYSRFIHALKLSNIQLDRKALAYLATNDLEGFKKVYEVAAKNGGFVETSKSQVDSPKTASQTGREKEDAETTTEVNPAESVPEAPASNPEN